MDSGDLAQEWAAYTHKQVDNALRKAIHDHLDRFPSLDEVKEHCRSEQIGHNGSVTYFWDDHKLIGFQSYLD